jgi:hypothetical protein
MTFDDVTVDSDQEFELHPDEGRVPIITILLDVGK